VPSFDFASIYRAGDVVPQDRGRGVRSWPLVTPETGSEQMLAGFTEIPVAGEIPLHTHSSEEFILVVEGSALVRVGGREEPVQAGDATHVQPDVVHQFVNTGTTPLRILWVYGAADTTRTLVETGETLGHLDPYPSDRASS
jgi:HTH-type transcriptional regulator, repressor for puuD